MCARVLGLMLWLVSASTVHIEIEARLGEDEICGQIRSDVGPPGPFSGWLGLITALDTLLCPGVGADRADPGHLNDPHGLTPRTSRRTDGRAPAAEAPLPLNQSE